MRNNHPTISFAYHFISEAIIIFLILLPIMYDHFFQVPYWSYLAITLVTTILFTMITRFTVNYFWYALTAPFIFGMFYFWGYPTVPAVLITILFIWRYINIRKEQVLSRENQYIIITLVLTVIMSLVIQDSRIMIFAFLQIIILITGYITSHLAVITKQERKEFDLKLSLYFVGFLALGAGLFFTLFDGIRGLLISVWHGLLQLLSLLLSGTSGFFSFLEIEQKELPEQDPAEISGDASYWNEPAKDYTTIESITSFVIIALVLLLLTFAFFLLRKRFRSIQKEKEKNVSISYSEPDQDTGQNLHSLRNRLKDLFKKPEHPVRRMVLQFERFAAKNNKGRKPFETIEDWFLRIGMNSDMTVYQKVRYGEVDVSNQEKELLKDQLKLMEKQISHSEAESEK